MRGTRVTVDIIADLFDAGDPVEALVAAFGITPDMIARALEWQRGFEASRRQRRFPRAKGRNRR